MKKETIIKLVSLNLLITIVDIILFSKAFFHIDIGGNAFSAAFGITAIIMSAAVFFYGNYKILFAKETIPKLDGIKTLDDCIDIINKNIDKKIFENKLNQVINQIRRFEKKETTVSDILLQKFSETEMSYLSFKNAITSLKNIMYLNTKSMLNRICAFDEEEYEEIRKNKLGSEITSGVIQSKLAIYNEYITFVDKGLEDNEQIILKLDKLLLEVSKLNSIEEGKIKDMPAMVEIDELISNTKWYKETT